MPTRFLIAVSALTSLAAALFLSQCYVPTYSDCAFRCGTAAPMCPAQYECRRDGYCHLPDSVAICAFGRDLGVAVDFSMDAANAVDADTD
jgi:hypothetical protein